MRDRRTISAPFVEDHPDQLLLLAQVAEAWRCRPSDLLGRGAREIPMDATIALQIDVAAAVVLWRWKEQNLARIARGSD